MKPSDPSFPLFCLLHGDIPISPLLIGQIPKAVAEILGWKCRKVFVTNRDAQKIRFHPMHGMDASRGIHLPIVIRHGDYFQSRRRGSNLQIEVVLHELQVPKRAYFLVLARNIEDTGIFIRTFYFNGEMSRNRMRDASSLLKQSSTDYFTNLKT